MIHHGILNRHILALLAVAALIIGGLSIPGVARASTLVVMNTNDSGPGSLRQAILDAASGDTITFDDSLRFHFIRLSSGGFGINKNLNIVGLPGMSVNLDGGLSQVFYIFPSIQLSLVDLMITDGIAAHGGAIYNAGSLTLTRCTVAHNRTDASGLGAGGAIYNDSGASLTVVNSNIGDNTGLGAHVYNKGTLTVSSSIFYRGAGGSGVVNFGTASINDTIFEGNIFSAIENAAGTMNMVGSAIYQNHSILGGGIFNTGGTVSITSSTISNNIADGEGGGILNDGGNITISNSTVSGNQASTGAGILSGTGSMYGGSSTLTVVNSTISGNSASQGGGINLYTSYAPSTIRLGSTIVAGNSGTSGADIFGAVTSLGSNLIGKTDGSSGYVASDQTGTVANPLDPKLNALALNPPGTTFTMSLQAISPAVHKGNCTTLSGIAPLVVDQRGVPRESPCDVGAYEYGNIVPTFTPATPTFITFNTLTVTAIGTTSATATQTGTPISGSSIFWVDDVVPAGATILAQNGDDWNWISSNPAPDAGLLSHQSNIPPGVSQHFFFDASDTLSINVGDVLIASVYLDPVNPPSTIMLQWHDRGGWEHRAYWGANNITWGVNGTISRKFQGALPPSGRWMRLQVPAREVGVEGLVLDGMAFTQYGGRATWDRAGKLTPYTPTPTSTATSTPTSTATPTATSTPVPPRPDTIGVYDNGVFYLRNSNTTGYADITVPYNPWNVPTSHLLPVVGDWNGDGVDTIGVYDTSLGVFLLRDSNTPGSYDYSLVMGNPGDEPIAGKWDASMSGSGVGVYRPSNGLLYVKKTLTTGFADYTMVLGNPGDHGIAGDWDGNGYDSVGVYRPSVTKFFLANLVAGDTNHAQVVFSDYAFVFGPANLTPLAGDWTGSGQSRVGYTLNGVFYLKYTFMDGGADSAFTYGLPGARPVAGKWTNGSLPPNIVVPVKTSVPPTRAPTSTATAQPGTGLD